MEVSKHARLVAGNTALRIFHACGAADITAELRALKPSEQMVYYRGDLAYDREDRRNTDNCNLNFIANTAFDLWRAGRVCLTQRRVSHFTSGNPPVFEYIATGCTLPAIPVRPKKIAATPSRFA